MKELDPYGCFTWSEDYTCICLLDNTSRYAVFNEETENKILMLERLQSLEPSKIQRLAKGDCRQGTNWCLRAARQCHLHERPGGKCDLLLPVL